MDHLPLEKGFRPADVPYIFDESCPYVYDNQEPMPEYLSRVGWSHRELLDFCAGHPPADSAHTQKQAASVLQAWLFFGLIPYIIRLELKTSDYLRVDDNGVTVITTRRLPEYLYEWRRHVETMDHDERLTYIKELDKSFQVAQSLYLGAGVEDRLLPPLATFAMTILINTLALVKIDMFPDSEIIEDKYHGSYNNTIAETLCNLGWCRGDVHRLYERFSSSTFLYLLSLGLNRSGRDHSLCEGITCQVTQVNNAVYIPQHVNHPDTEHRCDCNSSKSPTRKLPRQSFSMSYRQSAWMINRQLKWSTFHLIPI
jgi:hypothetical protein